MFTGFLLDMMDNGGVFLTKVPLRDVTGAEDSSNAEKPAEVLECLDDLEIEVPGGLLVVPEVPGGLLGVPEGPGGTLVEVQTSDLAILSPSLGQVQPLHQHFLMTSN